MPQPCSLSERKNNKDVININQQRVHQPQRNRLAFLEDVQHLFVYQQQQRTLKPTSTRHLSLADSAMRSSHSDNMARGNWSVS